MKLLLVLTLALAAVARADGPARLTEAQRAQAKADGVEWQHGRCEGGLKPSANCQNCSTCFYCGKRGRWGARPKNSGTCWMCTHSPLDKL